MLPASRESEFLLKMIKAWQKEDAARIFRRCDGDQYRAGGAVGYPSTLCVFAPWMGAAF